MWFDENLACKRIGTFGEGKDEAGMMTDFAEFMGKWKPHLVTWNGRGFDLPVLALRALRFGLDFRWYYRGEGYRYRFTEEGHLDPLGVVIRSRRGQDDSLDGAARTIGCPARTASTVARRGAVPRGQLDAAPLLPVRRRADGVPVPALPAGVGDLDRDGYRHAASGMLAALETDGRFAACSTVSTARLLLSDWIPEPIAPAARFRRPNAVARECRKRSCVVSR
jgi:hypothetical protein